MQRSATKMSAFACAVLCVLVTVAAQVPDSGDVILVPTDQLLQDLPSSAVLAADSPTIDVALTLAVVKVSWVKLYCERSQPHPSLQE